MALGSAAVFVAAVFLLLVGLGELCLLEGAGEDEEVALDLAALGMARRSESCGLERTIRNVEGWERKFGSAIELNMAIPCLWLLCINKSFLFQFLLNRLRALENFTKLSWSYR